MRGHCFAWMANVLAMAKKKNSLNSECSDVRDYGAVARQSFWCPVWSPCIEPRPKIKAFDFWHPIPFSHRSTVPFCQSFRLFQWYLMEKVQQKSQTDRIVAELSLSRLLTKEVVLYYFCKWGHLILQEPLRAVTVAMLLCFAVLEPFSAAVNVCWLRR